MSKEQPAMSNVNHGLQAGRDIHIHNSTFNQGGQETDVKSGQDSPRESIVLKARLMINSMPAIPRLPQYDESSRPAAISTWYGRLDLGFGGV